jgi:hypothetical protein
MVTFEEQSVGNHRPGDPPRDDEPVHSARRQCLSYLRRMTSSAIGSKPMCSSESVTRPRLGRPSAPRRPRSHSRRISVSVPVSGGPWSAWRGETISGQSSGVAPSVSQPSWSPSMDEANGRKPPGSGQTASGWNSGIPPVVLGRHRRAVSASRPVPSVSAARCCGVGVGRGAGGVHGPGSTSMRKAVRAAAVGDEGGQCRQERSAVVVPGVGARARPVFVEGDDRPRVGIVGCRGVPVQNVAHPGLTPGQQSVGGVPPCAVKPARVLEPPFPGARHVQPESLPDVQRAVGGGDRLVVGGQPDPEPGLDGVPVDGGGGSVGRDRSEQVGEGGDV